MKFEKPTLKEWNAAEKLADPVAFKAWVKRLVRRDKRYLKEVAADDTDSTYEVVEDDVEFEAVVKIFQELVEDTDFEM